MKFFQRSFRSKLILVTIFLNVALVVAFAVPVYLNFSLSAAEDFDNKLHQAAEYVYRGPGSSLHNFGHIERWFLENTDPRFSEDFLFFAQHKHWDVSYISQGWPEFLDPVEEFDFLLESEVDYHNMEDFSSGSNMAEWPGRDDHQLARPVRVEGKLRPPKLKLHDEYEFHQIFTKTIMETDYRFILAGNNDELFLLGWKLTPLYAQQAEIKNVFYQLIPLVLILSTISSWVLASSALRPVKKLAEKMEEITEEKLHSQVPQLSRDMEFIRLTNDFNEMLNRLSESFARIHRYNANAAHELKTPLMILSTQIDEAILQEEEGSDRQLFLVELLDEIDRLTVVIERLLLLSKAESGNLQLMRVRVNFSRELEMLIEDFKELADGFTIKENIQPRIYVNAELQLLLQTVENLLTNAMKYNDDRKKITIVLDKHEGQARLQVSNTGKLVTPEEAKKFFKHYFRSEQDVIKKIEGHGLGLPLAKEIAKAHGGNLRFLKSTEEKTTFELKIELAED